jgi:hypothetical protein
VSSKRLTDISQDSDRIGRGRSQGASSSYDALRGSSSREVRPSQDVGSSSVQRDQYVSKDGGNQMQWFQHSKSPHDKTVFWDTFTEPVTDKEKELILAHRRPSSQELEGLNTLYQLASDHKRNGDKVDRRQFQATDAKEKDYRYQISEVSHNPPPIGWELPNVDERDSVVNKLVYAEMGVDQAIAQWQGYQKVIQSSERSREAFENSAAKKEFSEQIVRARSKYDTALDRVRGYIEKRRAPMDELLAMATRDAEWSESTFTKALQSYQQRKPIEHYHGYADQGTRENYVNQLAKNYKDCVERKDLIKEKIATRERFLEQKEQESRERYSQRDADKRAALAKKST